MFIACLLFVCVTRTEALREKGCYLFYPLLHILSIKQSHIVGLPQSLLSKWVNKYSQAVQRQHYFTFLFPINNQLILCLQSRFPKTTCSSYFHVRVSIPWTSICPVSNLGITKLSGMRRYLELLILNLVFTFSITLFYSTFLSYFSYYVFSSNMLQY